MSLQVKIHKLLLKSRFRTRNKQEADLFFVPTYVKCVRMLGGLTDKEINHTYVKVLQYVLLDSITYRAKSNLFAMGYLYHSTKYIPFTL